MVKKLVKVSAFRTSQIKDNRSFTHDSPGRSVKGIPDA